VSAPPFLGQPGYEDDDPQPDLTMVILHEALDLLATAALAAETDEAARVHGLLGEVETVAFGFAADSAEANGLNLLTGAIRRRAEAA